MKLTYIITVASLAITTLAAPLPLPQDGSNNIGGCGKRSRICGKREEDTTDGVGYWKREDETTDGVGYWKKREDIIDIAGWWKRLLKREEETTDGVGYWKK